MNPSTGPVDMVPVGTVRSPRREVVDDDWGAVVSTIELLAPYGPAALAGLDQFSHVEILFLFDQVDPTAVCTGARHPRGNPAWPAVGIFAQRAKDRPNRIGLCTSRLLGVDGTSLRVQGLDAVDGTPVLDVKPHMAELGPRGTVHQPSWSTELMAGYF
ncbi:MAG TPA: SAM-dependent methyltransferase [Acidimicrobiales bacterium]|jgi:tRNA-Thr(GGU) m(6)t(6)A37 methyltransferase TsaA|nr:SAM-dependent methyltransferase [Acidimicrobiales bacterium]